MTTLTDDSFTRAMAHAELNSELMEEQFELQGKLTKLLFEARSAYDAKFLACYQEMLQELQASNPASPAAIHAAAFLKKEVRDFISQNALEVAEKNLEAWEEKRRTGLAELPELPSSQAS